MKRTKTMQHGLADMVSSKRFTIEELRRKKAKRAYERFEEFADFVMAFMGRMGHAGKHKGIRKLISLPIFSTVLDFLGHNYDCQGLFRTKELFLDLSYFYMCYDRPGCWRACPDGQTLAMFVYGFDRTPDKHLGKGRYCAYESNTLLKNFVSKVSLIQVWLSSMEGFDYESKSMDTGQSCSVCGHFANGFMGHAIRSCPICFESEAKQFFSHLVLCVWTNPNEKNILYTEQAILEDSEEVMAHNVGHPIPHAPLLNPEYFTSRFVCSKECVDESENIWKYDIMGHFMQSGLNIKHTAWCYEWMVAVIPFNSSPMKFSDFPKTWHNLTSFAGISLLSTRTEAFFLRFFTVRKEMERLCREYLKSIGIKRMHFPIYSWGTTMIHDLPRLNLELNEMTEDEKSAYHLIGGTDPRGYALLDWIYILEITDK